MVNLAYTNITGRGLKELSDLKNLSELYLGGINLTDADVPFIARHTGLRRLGLAWTAELSEPTG